ncbi:MAG: pilus assembly protein PilM [Christensenellales bacterium]|jgi:type IV pilus assembly protein PilM
MAFAKGGIIGVDIGSSSVKLVESLEPGKIARAGYATVPENTLSNGKLNNPGALVAAFKDAQKSSGIKRGKCSLTISGPEIILRNSVLPYMEKDQLYQNVIADISTYLPINTKKYYFDYRIQDMIEEEGNKKVKVMVAAAPRDLVDAYNYCLASVGLKVTTVDVIENSWEKLVRYLSSKNLTSGDYYGVISFGHSHTIVSVYGNGTFFVNKVVEQGGQALLSSLMQNMHVNSLAEARELLKNDIFSEAAGEPVRNAVTAHFNYLLSEASRVFDFFRYRNDQAALQALYVCGGYSTIPGLTQAVENMVHIPVHLFSDLVRLMFTKNAELLTQADFSGAIGATFRGE